MNPMVSEIIIGVVLATIILAFIAPFFTSGIDTNVYRWNVYHNRGMYKVCYLDNIREMNCITKSYEINGVEFVTSSKEQACWIADSLNTSEQNRIAGAKAKEWHRINC